MRFQKAFLILFLAMTIVACSGGEGRVAKYVERANVSLEEGDFLKAEIDAKNALQIDPKNVDALWAYALVSEKQQKWRRMFQVLNEIARTDSTHVEARVKLAQLYLTNRTPESLEKARTYADEALALEPTNEDARTVRAGVTHAMGDTPAAIRDAQAILERSPGHPSATALLAAIKSSAEPDEALAILTSSIESQEDSVSKSTLWLLKIGLLQKLQRYEEVEDGMRELVKLFPDNHQFRVQLARFINQQGRSEEAEAEYLAAVEAHPDEPSVKLAYAQALVSQQKYDETERVLLEYVDSTGDSKAQFQFALARLYEGQERKTEAATILETVIAEEGTDPNGLEARNMLAALVYRDRPEDAASYLAEVIENDSQNVDALRMRATMRLSDRDFEGAITDLRTVLRSEPNNVRAWLMIGKAHTDAGDPDLAEEAYQQVLTIDKSVTDPKRRRDLGLDRFALDAKVDLARSLIRKGENAKAEPLLTDVVEARPGNPLASSLLVDVLIAQQDWGAARQRAEAVLQSDADEDAALGYYLLGRVQAGQKNYEDSIESFTAAVNANPLAVEPLINLGAAYLEMGRLDDAISFFQSHLAEYPDQAHGHNLLGELYVRDSDLERAKSEFARAIELNERWIPAYRNLATVKAEEEAYGEAIEIYNKALEVLPGNIELSLLLAAVHERAESIDEAITIYESLLRDRDDLDIAANNVAALISDYRTDEENLRRALNYAQRFRGSDNPVFLDTLGWVYYRMGDYQKAVPLLEDAVEKAGQIPQLRYHLGMAYIGANRTADARRELEASLASNLTFKGREEASEALATL